MYPAPVMVLDAAVLLGDIIDAPVTQVRCLLKSSWEQVWKAWRRGTLAVCIQMLRRERKSLLFLLGGDGQMIRLTEVLEDDPPARYDIGFLRFVQKCQLIKRQQRAKVAISGRINNI